MKDLLQEMCRESVTLLKHHEHVQPAENLCRGLSSLTYTPFDHHAAVRYAIAALQEMGLRAANESDKEGAEALREVLPSSLARTLVMMLEYVHEHAKQDTTPSRAEAEFIFNVTCAVCTFMARMVDNRKDTHRPLYPNEKSWAERSWVRHSLTATIEDKIRSLQPRRQATQAELFADIGLNIEHALPRDQEERNEEALRKIRAVMSGAATSLEHISNSSTKDDSKPKSKRASSDDSESTYESLGVASSFSTVIASTQAFIREQGREQDKQYSKSNRSLYELRCDAHTSELLYSIGCSLCVFLMAVFIESYR